MKLLIIPALMLSACTTAVIPPIASIPVCNIANGTLVDERVVLTAQASYNFAANTYLTANDAGKLSPTVKTVVRPKIIKMYELLQVIKSAKGTVNCDVGSMQSLYNEVIALIPR